MRTLTLAGMAFVLGGCSLIPEYQRPEAPTPEQYPQAGVYALAQAARWRPPRTGSSCSMTRRCNS